LIAVLVFGGAAAFTIRTFFTRAVRVPTGAMANTIVPGDHLFIHKLFGQPSRGDIVIFQYNEGSETFVSRIIGLPGEGIQLRGKAVYINGSALDEERVMVESMDDAYGPLKEISTEGSGPYRVFYTKHSFEDTEAAEPSDGDFGTVTPFRIPDDNYFMLGDNRDNSEDSRYRGSVPLKLIWGKASIIYYSVKMPSQDEVRWDRMFKKVK
jgi:signal peptidase I